MAYGQEGATVPYTRTAANTILVRVRVPYPAAGDFTPVPVRSGGTRTRTSTAISRIPYSTRLRLPYEYTVCQYGLNRVRYSTVPHEKLTSYLVIFCRRHRLVGASQVKGRGESVACVTHASKLRRATQDLHRTNIFKHSYQRENKPTENIRPTTFRVCREARRPFAQR